MPCGTICIEKQFCQTMHYVGVSTVQRVIEGLILFVILSAPFQYRNSINNNLDNPKNLWRIIRSLAPSKCSKLQNRVTNDGTNYDDYDIVNLFNEHFANISSSIQLTHASDPPNWERITKYVISKLPPGVSYFIPPISENFVKLQLEIICSKWFECRGNV